MNKYLIRNVGVDFLTDLDDISELCARTVNLLLSIDNKNETAASFNGGFVCRVSIFEISISWKVFNLELDVGIVIDLKSFHFRGWGQEEGLMRRHLLEHDSLDRGFARSAD